jgi:hypothetical protein
MTSSVINFDCIFDSTYNGVLNRAFDVCMSSPIRTFSLDEVEADVSALFVRPRGLCLAQLDQDLGGLRSSQGVVGIVKGLSSPTSRHLQWRQVLKRGLP